MNGIEILAKITDCDEGHLECHVTARGVNDPDFNLVNAASMLSEFLSAACNARLSCSAADVGSSLETLRSMMTLLEGYLVYLQASDENETANDDLDVTDVMNELKRIMDDLNSDDNE